MATILDEFVPYNRYEQDKLVRRLCGPADIAIVIHEPDRPLDDRAEVWRELILEGGADDTDD